MTTPQLLVLLQKKYSPPEYAFLTEVRNGTGFARSPRTADALAFNLWPSRGMELLGFELKVSRSDWLHELKDPAKADAIANYCDRWWIVVGDEKVIPDLAEVPKTWGVQIATEKGLKVAKEAPENPNLKPLDRLFLFACIRQYGAGPSATIEEVRRQGHTQGYKDGKRDSELEIKRLTDNFDRLQRDIRNFESESGLKFHDWPHGHCAEVSKFLKSGGIDAIRKDLAQLHSQARRITEEIDGVLKTEERSALATNDFDEEEIAT